MTGPPGRPLRAGASIIDILGAVFGVVAAQAALRERETTGKGQRVSSALFESAAFLMSTHMAGIAATGRPMEPMPIRRGAWAIYEVFQTAGGGELFIGVTSDQQWVRFTEEFGLQGLAKDPRLATNVMRNNERAWMIPPIIEVLSKLPQEEVARRCERANVSWSPVARPQDLYGDAHLLASGGLIDVFISQVGGENGPKVGLPALPVEFGTPRQRPGLRRQSPRMGEHNDEILAEAGYTPAGIAGLREANVIASAG